MLNQIKKKKILYALVGVGTGNASRTLAILNELPPDKYDIQIIAQGRAYDILGKWYPMHALEEITYASGQFTLFNILKKNYLFPFKLCKNIRRCASILDEFKPDLLIVDSDFYSIIPAKRRKIPVISVNSSLATVAKFREIRSSAPGCFFSYHFIEQVDAWIQRHFMDLVLCPVFETLNGLGSQCRQIHPIVRRQFLNPPPGQKQLQEYDVVVLFGGSGIGAAELDLREYSGTCLVLGQSENLKLPSQATCIPYESDPCKYLSSARIIVVQGGFNSISEVMALRKPSVFVPINGHAEQLVNVRWAQDLGFGIVSRGEDVVQAIRRLESQYPVFLDHCLKRNIPCDGAMQAAQAIQEFADG
jgi:uncharacterized protein (TIGR00661 family)